MVMVLCTGEPLYVDIQVLLYTALWGSSSYYKAMGRPTLL